MIVAAGICALAWLLGLLAFVRHIESLSEPAITDQLAATDAIVVLTGGSDRVATGLDLLKAGKGRKLFISGVHPGLTQDRLFANQNITKTLQSCCIILGHAAGSTRGNAEETSNWMQQEQYHSLRLVTANYHMQRSLMIFHAVLPDILIIPHPVKPDSVKLDGWWNRPGTASLLVTEYNKFLWATLWLGAAR